MNKTKDRPNFVRKKKESKGAEIPIGLRDLGIKLSESLPTYDVPIDLIEPNDWNANEMDDKAFNRLAQEIEESGFVDPIQIAPKKGNRFSIIGGEHRWQVARTLGHETIPCTILLDKKFADEDLRKFLSVRLNVIKGKLNPTKFMEMYNDVSKRYSAEQLQVLFGYTETDAWKKLTKGVEDAIDDVGILGTEAKEEFKKKTRKVKTVDGLGKILNGLFKKYGSDLKHSFMVFTYGGKEHLYVIASDKTVAALDYIKSHCRNTGVDINDIVGTALQAVVSELNSKDDSRDGD